MPLLKRTLKTGSSLLLLSPELNGVGSPDWQSTKDVRPFCQGFSQSPELIRKEQPPAPCPLPSGNTRILGKGEIILTHASAGVSGITSIIYAPESTSGKSRWRSFSSLALLLRTNIPVLLLGNNGAPARLLLLP